MSEDDQSPIIEICDLRKSYYSRSSHIEVLDGVEFEIRANEFVSVVGPSGCGKTTILKIVAGLILPSSGTVKLEGVSVHGPQRKIGIVFQVPALMKWRASLKNVLLPAEILRLDYREVYERALEILKLVGLEEFADKYPHELSGGMQQRVALARALIHDPSILLLDEPFGALDTITRGQMNLELLRIWSERKKTSLLITHSIPESVFLSDRVVVLSPRPARVLDILKISLPRPRSSEMRGSTEFMKLVAEVGRRIGLEYV